MVGFSVRPSPLPAADVFVRVFLTAPHEELADLVDGVGQLADAEARPGRGVQRAPHVRLVLARHAETLRG